MGTFKNLKGLIYGRLKVIERTDNKDKRVTWLCLCNCGTPKIATTQLLRRGAVRSCGCLFDEWAIQFGVSRTNSGDNRAYHPLYNIFMGMHARCYNKKHQQYNGYGGRGIKVCIAWHNFWKFVEDMGERPSLDHTLDREDNDGPYAKSNCRWATWDEQGANRRKRKLHVLDEVCVHTKVGSETT